MHIVVIGGLLLLFFFFSKFSVRILLGKSTGVVLYTRHPNNLNLFKVSIYVIVLGGRFKKRGGYSCLVKKYNNKK